MGIGRADPVLPLSPRTQTPTPALTPITHNLKPRAKICESATRSTCSLARILYNRGRAVCAAGPVGCPLAALTGGQRGDTNVGRDPVAHPAGAWPTQRQAPRAGETGAPRGLQPTGREQDG